MQINKCILWRKGREKTLEIESGNNRSHCMENSLWKKKNERKIVRNM